MHVGDTSDRMGAGLQAVNYGSDGAFEWAPGRVHPHQGACTRRYAHSTAAARRPFFLRIPRTLRFPSAIGLMARKREKCALLLPAHRPPGPSISRVKLSKGA